LFLLIWWVVAEGDSGAWVVHAAASELYGHVVATDALGDAYVLPALATFENMRECLGAAAVTLPTTYDLGHRKSSGNPLRPSKKRLPKKARRGFPRTTVHDLRGLIYNRKHLDKFLYDCWEELRSERNFIDYFLQPFEISTPCWEATIVKRYMEQALKSSEIRLDDRKVGTKDSHQYVNTLSVGELYSYLRENPFQVDSPNTHRRLISVCNLDATTIHTLAETALWHQRDCLKDAFWKHISFETSIKVGQAIDGFETPHIELHLPYLALRTVSTTYVTNADSNDASRTEWEDVTFLNHEDRIDRDLIYQGHLSVVVCIWDHSRWTGYKFFNPPPISTAGFSGEENEDVEEDESDTEEDCTPRADIFAPDDVEEFVSDHPIWDPRKYFVRIAAVWVGSLLNEYTYVVRTLEERVKARVS
jgi:hypothetical protein